MIQDGARRRYMVPLALHRAGILEQVFIDSFVGVGSLEERIGLLAGRLWPDLGRRILNLRCSDLQAARVIRNPGLALRARVGARRFATPEESFLWTSGEVAKWIARVGFRHANLLYGFIRNAPPSTYRQARAEGLCTVGEQIIAPLEVEIAEMRRQVGRWPGWNDRETLVPPRAYREMEEQTWELADHITCMSEYVRSGLISVGVAPEKISVLPYPWIDATPRGAARGEGPLRVGFVGAVSLRKGAPYFLETARRFDPRQATFTMVGPIKVNREKLAPYRDHVRFVGPVPRSGIDDWLRRFDVFFFPSTCEGSAGAVMEAMASGLPVLTTFNSGSRVRHGSDGFILPYDDIDGFELAIRRFADDRETLRAMGQAARQRVLEYDLDAYQIDLKRLFQALVSEH